MVPTDGSSLKKTNTAHRVGEARRGSEGKGERRRAGREAKPRESVANQALACLPSPSFLPCPTQPCVQLRATHCAPLHVTSPRHPQHFLQSELDGAMSIDSTIGAVTIDHNPNPKGGVDVFLFLPYIANVRRFQRQLLLPSSSAGMKVYGILRACQFYLLRMV